MNKEKKRIEVIYELYTSEREYLKDLTIWEVDFRR